VRYNVVLNAARDRERKDRYEKPADLYGQDGERESYAKAERRVSGKAGALGSNSMSFWRLECVD